MNKAREFDRSVLEELRALLGDRSESERERIVRRIQPCEAC